MGIGRFRRKNWQLTWMLMIFSCLLAISFVSYITSTKQDEGRLSPDMFEACFDNLTGAKSLCNISGGGSVPFKDVTSNDVVLLGDSHSFVVAHVLLLTKMRGAGAKRILFGGVSSCLPFNGYIHEVKNRQLSCQAFSRLARDIARSGGVLLVSAKWEKYLQKLGEANFINNLQSTFDDKGMSNVYFILQAPSFSLPPSAQVGFHSVHAKSYVTPYLDLIAKESLIFEHVGANAVSVFESLCDDIYCYQFLNQNSQSTSRWAYADTNHLSENGAKFLSSSTSFAKIIKIVLSKR